MNESEQKETIENLKKANQDLCEKNEKLIQEQDKEKLRRENESFQNEITKLKSRNFIDLINRLYWRGLVLLVGSGVAIFVYGPMSAILSTDIKTFFPSEISTVKVTVVDSAKLPQKAISTPNIATGSEATAKDAKPDSGEASTAYVSLVSVYGIKVLGSIAVLYAFFWTLLALIRSDPDQRD